MLGVILNYIDTFIRWLVVKITNFLPVKIIRDDYGRPFLYRYHVFALTKDGPGICFHHFVKSDPDRGYHDHPWNSSLSFILAGGYNELIYNPITKLFTKFRRNSWNFNYLNGTNFHRVMLPPGEDAWTLFFFGKRAKTWGMYKLDGTFQPMSTSVEDQDGGWWNWVPKGISTHAHLEHPGKVIATVDIVVIAEVSNTRKILLIQRGKEPYKDCWALPGGRIEQKDDSILAAACRELDEETQIIKLNPDLEVNLIHVTTIGNNRRDPRGFCLTNVFMMKLFEIPKVRANDDAVNYTWANLEDLPPMAFDHKDILKKI